MEAKIIDGKKIASLIKDNLKLEVAKLQAQNIFPTLAVIQVGDNPASSVYVRNKQKACAELGIQSQTHTLPANTSEQDLLNLIEALNQNPEVHGILVQLPLPFHISTDLVIETIAPHKDVDGFHYGNMGNLCIGKPTFLPCTPAGIMELLKHSQIDIAGKHCVVVGRSNIVGKPIALLMLQGNATVTIAHSQTANLSALTKQADILIVAMGKAKFITAEHVKAGAVVIDVGIHRQKIDNKTKLCGDVNFDSVLPKVSRITPVPGGVGVMTIAMLMFNCVEACKQIHNL